MGDRSPRREIALRIIVSGTTGGADFVISDLLQSPLHVALGEQFILSLLVGGVTLIAQFLVGFERAQAQWVERLDRKQDELVRSVTADLATLEQRLTELDQDLPRQLMSQSVPADDQLLELLQRASRITPATPPLIVDLTKAQLDRVSVLMRHMSDEATTKMAFDGEDREWLLSLAQNARESIVATSVFTVDAGRWTFDGDFWLSDLGSRYLAVQRAACRRGVEIRRIFVYGSPEFVHDESFVRVRRLHREAGVQIKGISEDTLRRN